VRDMVERAFGCRHIVSFYQLGRAEGGVLRYLSDAYRALERTIPEQAKTPELEELIEWLGELVRQVDSSLIDEWEELANTRAEEGVPALTRSPDDDARLAPPTRSLLANERAFTVVVRNALFRRVQAAAFERYDELAELDAPYGFSGDAWRDALDGYF